VTNFGTSVRGIRRTLPNQRHYLQEEDRQPRHSDRRQKAGQLTSLKVGARPNSRELVTIDSDEERSEVQVGRQDYLPDADGGVSGKFQTS